jgi:hypothetical protein
VVAATSADTRHSASSTRHKKPAPPAVCLKWDLHRLQGTTGDQQHYPQSQILGLLARLTCGLRRLGSTREFEALEASLSTQTLYHYRVIIGLDHHCFVRYR